MRLHSALRLVESKAASTYPSRQSAFFVLHVPGFETHVTRPDQGLLADCKRDTGNEVENPYLKTAKLKT